MMLDGYGTQIFIGAWLTIKLTLSALSLGVLLGVLLAAGKLNQHKLIAKSCSVFTTIICGLPELLVLFIIYFGSEILLKIVAGRYININYFFTGTIVLGIIFSSYFSETLKGAYLTISKGSIEAVHAFGFSSHQRFIHILLPKMWRYALPGFSNLCLVLLKDTSIVSLIGLQEMLRAASVAGSATQKPLFFYGFVGLLYLTFTTVLMLMIKWMENKLRIHQ